MGNNLINIMITLKIPMITNISSLYCIKMISLKNRMIYRRKLQDYYKILKDSNTTLTIILNNDIVKNIT